MEATAFCPAHITGFFKAHLDENQNSLKNLNNSKKKKFFRKFQLDL